ncbi:MAG: hypothetical protein AAFR97_02490 [Bacteroidota bacterium]
MTATELRSDLLQQIKQADEKLLRIISSVVEAVKTEYASEEDDFDMAAYEASLKPMTIEELEARAIASNEDFEAGRVYDLDEVAAEMGL